MAHGRVRDVAEDREAGRRARGRFGALASSLLILALSGGGPGCGGRDAEGGPASASAAPEPAPTPGADTSASAAPAGSEAAPPADTAEVPPPNGAPVGKGIDSFEGLAKCNAASSTAAEYLQRGELTIAGRPKEIGLAWLVQLKGRAQIGFGGFDEEAKQSARSRGVASAREHAPRLFSSGTDWTLAWFDDEGLAYAHPRFQLQPAPEIEHLSSVRDVPAEDVALAGTPDGSLLAASTFGAGGQLSLFLFAPVDDTSPKARAIGLTKTAKGPKRPAAVADDRGYTLAWVESDGSIAATRFDREGKELHPSATIISGVGDRVGLTLAPLGKGSLLVWSESGEVRARALDAAGRPSSPAWRVGKGQWPTVSTRGEDVLVAWVGEAEGQPQQVLAARVGPNGPAAKGRRITSSGAAEAPAVVAMAGNRAAFAWPEKMSASIQSFRAVLRTVDGACFD